LTNPPSTANHRPLPRRTEALSLTPRFSEVLGTRPALLTVSTVFPPYKFVCPNSSALPFSPLPSVQRLLTFLHRLVSRRIRPLQRLRIDPQECVSRLIPQLHIRILE